MYSIVSILPDMLNDMLSGLGRDWMEPTGGTSQVSGFVSCITYAMESWSGRQWGR